MDDTGAEADRPAEEEADRIEAQVRDWEDNELAKFLAKRPETKERYFSGSAAPVQRVYTPADVADVPFEEIGLPGQYPFTRWPYPTRYRGRPWTMRPIQSFGTPPNREPRFHYRTAHG